MKKKLLAMGLTLAMALGMSTTAFAVTITPTYEDQKTVTIEKNYQLEGAGISPAETFTLTQIGNGVVADGDAASAPALGEISTVTYVAGAAGKEGKASGGMTGTFTVNLPTYERTGVYEYVLRESVGSTAGVTYRTSDIKLVVTVVEENGLLRVAGVHTEDTSDESAKKSGSFDNTYTANTLSVKKTVTGNLGDKKKEFQFTVTFTAPNGKTWNSADATSGIIVSGGASNLQWNETHTVATFTLSDEDTVNFANIPQGVTYVVAEDSYVSDGYTTTYDGKQTGTMGKTAITTVVNNDKQQDVDTGINLDNLPYILILAVVICGGLAFVVSRRRRFE